MNHRDLLDLFRSSHRICSVKKCVPKNFANFPSQESTCAGVFLIALQVEFSSAEDCFYLLHLKILQQIVVASLDQTRPRQSVKYFFKADRNSRPEVFCKKVVLRNFTKFTGKHLCQSLFLNKVAVEHLWWLLLNVTSLFNQMQPKIKKVSLTFQLAFLLSF